MQAQSNPILLAKARSKRIVIVDLVFAFLPGFMLFFFRLLSLDFSDFFTRSDWSYVSLILVGQSIAKFGFAVASNETKKSTSYVLVVFTALVVVFIFTSIVLVQMEMVRPPTFILLVFQYIFVLVSVATYYLVGVVSNIMAENAKVRLEDIHEAEKIEEQKG